MRHNTDFFVFDLETSCLKYEDGVIMSMAFCVMDWDLEIKSKLSTMIKPYVEQTLFSPQALKVNGLSVQDVTDKGITAREAVQKIIDLALKSKVKTSKQPVLCGHNIDNFDIPWLERMFSLQGEQLFKYFDKKTVDTLFWARLKEANPPSFKLADVCKEANLILEQELAHTAEGDVSTTTELVKTYLKALRGEGVRLSIEEKNPKRKKFYINYAAQQLSKTDEHGEKGS